MTTGEKLQKLRKEKNYTQEELADILGVSRQSISKWESDVAFPETDKLITLSKLFQCSIDYLLNEENNGKEFIDEKTDNKTEKYNKKKLPFAITSFSVSLITFIIFSFNWFTGYRYYVSFFGNNYFSLNGINLYQTLFSNFYDAGNFFVLLSFLTTLAISISSVFYLYFDSKSLNLTIKILNCLLLLLLTIVCLGSGAGWTGAVLVEGLLLVSLIVLQFTLKPLKEAY